MVEARQQTFNHQDSSSQNDVRADLKPYPCSNGNRQFSRSDNRRRHETSCDTLKAYDCVNWPKKFARKDNLQRHIRTTHEGQSPTHIKSSHKDDRKMVDKSAQTTSEMSTDDHPLSIYDGVPNREELRRRFLKKFNLLDVAPKRVLHKWVN